MMIQLSTSTYYCQFTCIPGIILKKIMDAHPKDGLSWKFEIRSLHHRCIGILNLIFDLYAPSLIKSYFLD